jgi:hypothetical protein
LPEALTWTLLMTTDSHPEFDEVTTVPELVDTEEPFVPEETVTPGVDTEEPFVPEETVTPGVDTEEPFVPEETVTPGVDTEEPFVPEETVASCVDADEWVATSELVDPREVEEAANPVLVVFWPTDVVFGEVAYRATWLDADRPERGFVDAECQTVVVAAGLTACVFFFAVLAALIGFDYVLPRHLLPAYVPLIAAVAVALGATRAGRAGLLIAAAGTALGFAVTLSINDSLTYQREDVRDVFRPLSVSASRLVIVQRPDNYLLRSQGMPAINYYAPSLRSLSSYSVAANQIDLIDESVSPASVLATLKRLRLLGFRVAYSRARQAFVTYDLVAPREVTLTRAGLKRDARFGGALPLLLVNCPPALGSPPRGVGRRSGACTS